MGVLHTSTPYSLDYLRFLEAPFIADLSVRGLWMVNTHTGANASSRRLSREQVKEGQQLAQVLATARTHVFGSMTNPYPSPSSNRREAAVRVVWQANRALNTEEVLVGMAAAGVHAGNARTPSYSTRRNLRRRESLEAPRHPPRLLDVTESSPRVLLPAHA